MAPDDDILSTSRGLLEAPAGCGKTEAIAKAIASDKNLSPILVLTHTNAGVHAIRERVARLAGKIKSRVQTIDSWCSRIVQAFPTRSGLTIEEALVLCEAEDYQAIERGTLAALRGRHINDILRANYTRVIVDEYQDCTELQHAIICELADVLPTVILGDPLQRIFGFGENRLPDWNIITDAFPLIDTLEVPWRWNACGSAELGAWLLEVREKLKTGAPIDLRGAPSPAVEWVPMSGTAADHAKRLKVANRLQRLPGKAIVVHDSSQAGRRERFARSVVMGTVVERSGLPDIAEIARKIRYSADASCEPLIALAHSIMTGVDVTSILRRISTLTRGRARTGPSEVEEALLAYLAQPSPTTMKSVLIAIRRQPGTRIYRPDVYRFVMRAILRATPDSSFDVPLRAVLEDARHEGRSLGKCAIGSTLLVKGLEAETSVVLFADDLDASNLYVAVTRGSRRLIIFSRSGILQPSRKEHHFGQATGRAAAATSGASRPDPTA